MFPEINLWKLFILGWKNIVIITLLYDSLLLVTRLQMRHHVNNLRGFAPLISNAIDTSDPWPYDDSRLYDPLWIVCVPKIHVFAFFFFVMVDTLFLAQQNGWKAGRKVCRRMTTERWSLQE